MILFAEKSRDGRLIPASLTDKEKFEKIPQGALVKIEYIKSRNYRNLQRYHVLIEYLWSSLDFAISAQFGNKEAFRKSLEYLAGNKIMLEIDGKPIYIVGSISYEAMPDEKEFEEHFDKLIDAALLYMPNWTKEQIKNDVDKIILNFA